MEESSLPREIEIVDAFTKLIFSGGDDLSSRELMIVQTLQLFDEVPACGSGKHGLEELSAFLRELGVSEMVALVAQVREQFPLAAQAQSPFGQDQHVQL